MKNSKSTTPSSEASQSQMDNYDEENTSTSTSTNCFDLSLLRKPIITSVTGFQEAKKAYDNGTEEIRKLLANECDLIYECKVCRNIFRSLVNFISHKRVYCQTTFNTSHHFHFNNNGFIDQDISTIIQAEQDFINNRRHTKSSNGSTKSRTETDLNKDLSSIVERLMKKQRSRNELKLSDFYEQIGNKFVSQGSETNGSTSSDNNIVLQLNSVPDSTAAVYQTVKINEHDNIKKEVNEVHEMLENNNILIGPDGKAVSVSPVDNPIAGTSKLPEHACEICDERFSTEKTLKIHIEKKHIPSTTVFRCPSCAETFLQPGAVLKHLSNVHQKSQKRIRQMRESICKRGTRLDEVKAQIKEAPLLKPFEKMEEITAWYKDFPKNIPSCPYCSKTFERKAVLVSHVQNCGIKESKSNSRKRTATPKILTTTIKTEPEFGDENSSTSCDTNTTKTLEIKAQSITPEPEKLIKAFTLNEKGIKVNKRKRKGPLVIRNESPEIKDEADMYWSTGDVDTASKGTLLIDESKIKTENEATDHEMVIEEPPKKRKIKKESEEGNVIKNIPCALCSKKFATNTNLKRHVAMFHFRQNRFACKLCEFRGYRRVDTITHLGNAHSIHGEKEEVNQYIEISVKEDDLRGPINTNEKCDPNLTFSSVVASILSSSSKNSASPKTNANQKSNLHKRMKTESKDKVLINKSKKEESGGSGGSTPSSEKNLEISDTKRPTRNRVKPVRKDFVYDLNKIIKQEAEVHREQQQQLLPIRNQRRRNTTVNSEVIIKESPKTEIELNKENLSVEKPESHPINEISGAALKMAKIEVMNQRACFHKPPVVPSERPNFIPAKVASAPRKTGKIIKNVTAMIKEPGAKGRKREVKRTPSFTDTFLSTTSSRDIKRTPSFTDTFVCTTSSAEKFNVKEPVNEQRINDSVSMQPVDTSTPMQSTKATKKQELSSKEKTQLEMLQRFRDQQNFSSKSIPPLSLNKSDITGMGKRISVLQRLAENKRKSQEFLQKPNYDKTESI